MLMHRELSGSTTQWVWVDSELCFSHKIKCKPGGHPSCWGLESPVRYWRATGPIVSSMGAAKAPKGTKKPALTPGIMRNHVQFAPGAWVPHLKKISKTILLSPLVCLGDGGVRGWRGREMAGFQLVKRHGRSLKINKETGRKRRKKDEKEEKMWLAAQRCLRRLSVSDVGPPLAMRPPQILDTHCSRKVSVAYGGCP